VNKPAKKAAAPARAMSVNAKQAILDAALKAFSRDGFDGASLPKIADMANIAHPLIHYHFGSKENLWRETVDYALGDLSREAATIRTASRGLSPLDRLRVLIRAFTHFAARCPDHFGLILAEARSDSDRFAWIQENYTADFLESLKAIIQEAQEQKQIRSIPLGNLAFMLMGSMLLYFTVNPTLPKDAELDQLADEHAELLIDIILNGIAA
jgi:AcrR family transcriptional regulator